MKSIMYFLSIVFILTVSTAGALKHKLELPEPIKAQMRQFYKNKHVLVTGGCGFIGSHISEKLVEFGAHVSIMDNLSTGFLDNIKHIKDQVTFHNKSVVDAQACLDATEGQDVIFHLAAFISVPESLEKPKLCHEVNVDGIFNLLEGARINKVKRFVFSSSSAVYGPTEGPCSETTTTNPASPYGFSKLIGEYLCKQYALNFGVDAVILRYYNVCGPRQNPKGAYAAVVARFTAHLKENKPIVIFGDGLQTRDFVSVEQVAEANLLMGMLESNKVRGEIVNVATGHSINLLALVDLLKEKFPHSTSPITFGPERSAGEIRNSSADISKFKSLIA